MSLQFDTKNYHQKDCLHKIFENRAVESPDAVAIEYNGQKLTYSELNNRANKLANYLKRAGVGPEILVALCAERSLEMVIGIYGILKAGGAYIPLDPNYPAERLSFMLEDCQAQILLTQEYLLDRLPVHSAKVVCLDKDWPVIRAESTENPANQVLLENLMYVLYTSGSTGKPKGCLNTHAALWNRILWMQDEYKLTISDRVLQKTPFSFDVSVWEFLWPLVSGATLVVAKPGGHMDPGYLIDLINSQQITTIHFVPSMLSVFLEEDGASKCQSLKRVICSGEALSTSLQQRFFSRLPAAQLYNLYGPTEAAIDVTHWMCRQQSSYNFVPIGQPVANTQIYILDKDLKPVPTGKTGELHIGGRQVARGYLNRQELTEKKFIPDPFSSIPGARLYKTGDLARCHDETIFEYIGRMDDQVKIRGFRIELGEIQSALDLHPDILENVVVVDSNENYGKRLIAYIVCPERKPTIVTLRNWLKKDLPEYMLPAVIIYLDRMPLTSNGKIDRRALPGPDNLRPSLQSKFIAPSTPEEKILAEIWSDILGLEQIGVHDNFFELGGDSIRSIQILARAKQKGIFLSLEQLFQSQTIHKLALQCRLTQNKTNVKKEIKPFSLLSKQDRQQLPTYLENAYPATQLQIGMLYHSEMQKDTAVYLDIFSYHIEAPLDQKKIVDAIQQLATRHPVLRTSFDLTNYSQPLQLVHKSTTLPVSFEDISHLRPTEQKNAVVNWIEREQNDSFGYSKAPLIRFKVHKTSSNTFYLSHSEHHAILDGWSLAVMVTELVQTYELLLYPKSSHPAFPDPVPFRNYVALEAKALQDEKHRQYWLKKLQGHHVCKLPRGPSKKHLGDKEKLSVHNISVSKEISDGLNVLAYQTGVPIKNVFLAAHIRALCFLCNQQDILTGVATNCRPEELNAENTLGLFLNVLPFRMQLKGGSWKQLIYDVFEAEKEMLPFRRYPLAEIQKDYGGANLFEAPFVMVNFHVLKHASVTNKIQFQQGPFFEFTNFPYFIFFVIDPFTDRVSIRIDFNGGQFCSEQIQEIAGYYHRILAAMASNPEGDYESFSLLSDNEKTKIIHEWNNNKVDYPSCCVHELFEENASKTPDAIAIFQDSHQVTYRELNDRSNQLANYLRKLGVGPDTIVALCVERSSEMIIGMLGILKAGGAYMPLDPVYPTDRLSFMLNDAQAQVLVTQKDMQDIPCNFKTRVIFLDTDWAEISRESIKNISCGTTSGNLAYVMYTSGSTGRPKGVAIPHRGVVRLVYNQEYLSFDSGNRFLLLAPFSFDASTFELWGALLFGASCVVYPKRYPSLPLLRELINKHSINVLWLTSSLFNLIIDEDPQILSPIKQLITGGEALSIAHVQQAFEQLPHMQIVNGYGPTESTTFACCYPIPDDFADELGSVPIGKPINNTEAYILDDNMQPVAIGVQGELYIGGDGLAIGYLNRPELNKEKFIPNPFSSLPEDRLYKTGDMARYLPDGNIEFLGRLDHQVKIRGFRVEPGEIESTLSTHPHIATNVVVTCKNSNNDHQLIAYLVATRRKELSIKEIRIFLSNKLPGHMVPAKFMVLEHIPLTLNGKVDRKALPSPEETFIERDSFVPPRNETEELLTIIWAHVLNVKQISVHDNFFELGGHSLMATQVVSRIRDWFEFEIPLRTVFENPTVARQAEYIENEFKDIENP